MRPLALVIVAALLGAAAPAAAAPAVTLNGVSIEGATNQKFESCTVVIDDKGNIDIQAKGYAVKSAEGQVQPGRAGSGGGIPQRSTSVAPRLSRRYFLATDQTPPGPQFDLAIFINAQWVREVKANEPSLVMEITKYLRPGQNKVTLAATKRLGGERLAFTKDVALRVVVGEGNVGGGGDHVMIDEPLIQASRTAIEMDDKTEEYVIDAR